MFFDQLAINTICYPLETENIKHVAPQHQPQPLLLSSQAELFISCWLTVKAERGLDWWE